MRRSQRCVAMLPDESDCTNQATATYEVVSSGLLEVTEILPLCSGCAGSDGARKISDEVMDR